MTPENLVLPEIGIRGKFGTGITVNWSAIPEGISQVIADIVFKSWADGGASATVSLVKVVSSLKFEESVGSKAFHLVALSMGWAIGQIVHQYNIEKEYVSQSIRASINEVRESLGEDSIILNGDFLTYPLRSPLFIVLKKSILQKLMLVLAERGYKEEVLSNKLDISFCRGLYDVWSSAPVSYSEICSVLKSPFSEISEQVLDWQAYKQQLISSFEVSAVFGQEIEGISLSQLYVPLRGYWTILPKSEGHPPHSHPGDPETGVAMIEDHINNWIGNSHNEDWLKLIGGGPGSGKSTTLKSIAAHYAKHDDWRVLFIPLQNIGVEGDLRERINEYFTGRSGGAFNHPPLSKISIENGPPLILIFDGLDEISAPNESTNDIVQFFTGKLTSLVVAIIGDDKRRLKVIVSGRLPSFQSAKRFLPIGEETAIEVYGFKPPYRTPNEEEGLWSIDQRPIWWRKFANAKSLNEDDIPEAITSNLLESISHEPLLCYLLAISNYTGENWKEAARNTNLIYKGLMNSVYERGWGDGIQKRLGPGKSMTLSEFNTLMQSFGLAAWLGGDARVASETDFLNTLKITRGDAAWEVFKRDNGTDINNLALNFYLKSNELSHRGFEFTHKSFGEYLAARQIVEFAFSIFDLVDRSMDAAIQEWFKATKTGIISFEILRFIENEIRLRSEGDLDQLRLVRKAFERMAYSVMTNGHVSASSPSFQSMLLYNINAETAVWSILSGLALRINEIVEEPELTNIPWKSSHELSQTLHRHHYSRFTSVSPADCMSYLNGNGQNLVALAIWSARLFGANLSSVSFESCNIFDADMRSANLQKASFIDCKITSSEFTSADFTNSIINDSSFDDCKFDDCIFDDMSIDVESLVKSGSSESIMNGNVKLILYRDNDGNRISIDSIESDYMGRFKLVRERVTRSTDE